MKVVFILIFLLPGLASSGQQRELKSKEMRSLLPDKIKGFHSEEGFINKRLKIGTISYTLCEKKFSKGKQSIKLLLFDFVNADIMYKQAMYSLHDGEAIETDSIVMRAILLDNSTGWESYRKSSQQSQVVLGVCNRFFLSMTGDKVDLALLKSVLDLVPIAKYPKLESTL
jgi:hypothetical protein